MLELDIRTLAIVASTTSLIPAVALYFQPGVNGDRGQDQTCWSLGFLILALGWGAIGLRGIIADLVSVPVGNTAIVLGYALILNGTRNYAGAAVGLRFPLIYAAAFLLLFGGAFMLDAGFNARVLIINLFVFGLIGGNITILHTASRKFNSRVIRVGEIIFLVLLAVTSLRLAVSLSASSVDFLHAGSVHSLSFLLYSMTNVALGMTFMAMLAQRLHRKLQREIDTRERLLALIGHDLRSTFNAILGGMQAMDIYAEKGQQQKILDTAQTVGAAARKVFELLETLLAWARTRPGLRIEADMIDLQSVISHVAGFFDSALREKELKLESRLGVREIHTDRLALEAILRNLLSNAVKFSPPNGRIVIETSMRQGRVAIDVSDEGQGMPNSVLQHLSRGMYSESATGTAGEAGAGMGLRLSMDLAHSLGGHLLATNRSQGGACLQLVIPVEQAVTPEIHH